VVRLVGLSGVGKTRFAQALFEGDISGRPIDHTLAVYTDLGTSPYPSPLDMATELNASRRRATLVIDNCPSDAHSELVKVCLEPGSQLSLLTIEYDIQDDQPDGTNVYKFDAASEELVRKIIRARFPTISHFDADRVARFSGGNARVAFVIADTIREGEAIYELNDATLFRRLFEQRKGSNDSLLRSAQACSLVYSFNVDDSADGNSSELGRLGAVMRRDLDSIYRDVELLRKRDLVQRRGGWRAILPHAIANRLARTAFEEILPSRIDQFVATATPRLLLSFSRRLGYLHDSLLVQERVRQWLSPGGMLADIRNLDENRLSIFRNVAPVDPAASLTVIERALAGCTVKEISRVSELLRPTLWSLAYDQDLFERVMNILINASEGLINEPDPKNKDEKISAFFTISLSGTHATVVQRIRLVQDLLSEPDQTRRELGKQALGAMLQTSHFMSFKNFDFGARQRDGGYSAKYEHEYVDWFRQVLVMCDRVDTGRRPGAQDVREILAGRLPNLWHSLPLRDELSVLCTAFSSREYWPEGWLAICSIRRWQSKNFDPVDRAKIVQLEHALRPVALNDRVDAFLKKNSRSGFWEEDGSKDGDDATYMEFLEEADKAGYRLGKEIANDSKVWTKVARYVLTSESHITFWKLMEGIVESSRDPIDAWKILLSSFRTIPPDQRNGACLASYLFLLQARDKEFVERTLDSTFEDCDLVEWIPVLQAQIGFDGNGTDRLLRSLSTPGIPSERYRRASFTLRQMSSEALRRVATDIVKRPDGFGVAQQLVWIAICGAEKQNRDLDSDLAAAGREILQKIRWELQGNGDDYHLAEIATACLSGPTGEVIARGVCASFIESNRFSILDLFQYRRLFETLAIQYPCSVLDGLLLPANLERHFMLRTSFEETMGSLFDTIEDGCLLDWCDRDAVIRYPLVAEAIRPFKESDNGEGCKWTRRALTLLAHAPEPAQVLRKFTEQFSPHFWSGSRAAIMESNTRLLEDLKGFERLASTIQEEKERLMEEVQATRQAEAREYSFRDERFE
jgi:hypothetical protein